MSQADAPTPPQNPRHLGTSRGTGGNTASLLQSEELPHLFLTGPGRSLLTSPEGFAEGHEVSLIIPSPLLPPETPHQP